MSHILQQDTLKPILKWVGGKRQLLDDILPLIPSNPSCYAEPFIGGAAVLLALRPEHAIINDYNPELVNVYRTVRDNPDELLERLEEHKANDSSDYYYQIRSLDRTADFDNLSEVNRAARVLYLNKTGYNGMFRVNSLGQLNVPYGRYKNPNIVNREGILALSEYLKGDIKILCGDYATALDTLDENSFVYLDPPYMPISPTAAFTGYTENGFGVAEQERLHSVCENLKSRGVHFIQSNSDCEFIRDLYCNFEIIQVKAKRSINANGSGRGEVPEVLIIG